MYNSLEKMSYHREGIKENTEYKFMKKKLLGQ